MSERSDGRKSDDAVWANLDRRFRAPLVAFFQRRVYDRTEAEDLTQEVFVRLTRRPDRHNGETIDAYVFKIAANVLIDWGRYRTSRRAAAHRTFSDITEDVGIPSILVEDRTPERVLAGKDALQNIEDALAELSARTREIFLLSRMENVHHRDIANLHGISVSAVEKHVLKAVAHLSARALRS
ncbi:MAG: sigma-70 family RNA polymerase sigma factor [Rhizomicrobium sp.]